MAVKKKIAISQRAYAKQIGVSNEAVRKAIEAGYIGKGFDPKTKGVFPEIANEEWGNLHRKININDLVNETDEPAPVGRKVSLNADTPLSEARRIKEVTSAQLLAIELKKAKGELVSKDAVVKELFAFGQIIRTELMQIPDRHIDNILASNSRTEAHTILYNAIADVLETMTERKEFKFENSK